MDAFERKGLVILRQVPLQPAPGIPSLQMRRLRLKVKESPELEAGIGHGQLYTFVSSQCPGPCQGCMLIYVEDGPDLIEQQVVVSLAPGVGTRLPLPSTGDANGSERLASLASDHNLDERIPGETTEIVKVSALSDLAFANDENPLPGLADSRPTLQAIT